MVDGRHERRGPARVGEVDGRVACEEQVHAPRVPFGRRLVQGCLAVRGPVVDIFRVRAQELAQLDLVAGPRGCVKLRHLVGVRVRGTATVRVGVGVLTSVKDSAVREHDSVCWRWCTVQ
eukprot:scaffold19028_cov47-Phaeocystis_antarctica.AAC.2